MVVKDSLTLFCLRLLISGYINPQRYRIAANYYCLLLRGGPKNYPVARAEQATGFKMMIGSKILYFLILIGSI
jgi:hypothetical protein